MTELKLVFDRPRRSGLFTQLNPDQISHIPKRQQELALRLNALRKGKDL